MLREWDGPKKSYSSEKACEEASEMEARTKSGEARNFNEAEKLAEEANVETELSPEIIEMIMNKVQNINQIGTAYSVMHTQIDETQKQTEEKFNQVLKNGLLGNSGGEISKDKWAKKVRENRVGVVFFNIIGTEKERTSWNGYFPVADYRSEFRNEFRMIADSRWFDSNLSDFTVAVIFDLSKFKPDLPLQGPQYGVGVKQKPDTFRYGYGKEDLRDIEDAENNKPDLETARKQYEQQIETLKKEGLIEHDYKFQEEDWPMWIPKIETEYGFSLSFRVAPRLFKGLVLRVEKAKAEEIMKKVDQIVASMREIDKEKEELILPIYDEDGNLLWPKQMSYHEVKKFVAERAAKTQEAKLDSSIRSE